MFLDTSGLYSFFDEKDFRNPDAVSQIGAANFFITHSYVLAEFIPLCLSRGLNRVKTLEFAETISKNELIEIIWINEEIHIKAFNLLKDRLDKSYSLCDAVSFIVMREHGITDALTTDRHFEQEGFIKLLVS
jgi:predicted nucleic acid-binding protein